jgi:hypothetical protein
MPRGRILPGMPFSDGAIAMSTHFRMTDLLTDPVLVENALSEGARFQVTIAEAMQFQKHLRGAIWSAETIHLTTDVARVLARGGQVTVPVDALMGFGASLVLDGKGPQRRMPVSTTIVVLVIAAAAVIGFAIDHVGATLQPDLMLTVSHDAGQVTVAA